MSYREDVQASLNNARVATTTSIGVVHQNCVKENLAESPDSLAGSHLWRLRRSAYTFRDLT